VRVSSGPAFSTRREEAREGMMALMQAAPHVVPVIADILVETLDFPKSKEMAERLRIFAQRQGFVVDPEQQQEPDPMQQAMMQMQMAGAEADIAKKQADAAKSAAEAEGKQIDNAVRASNPIAVIPQ